MSSRTEKEVSANTLNAAELLKNKGICHEAWVKWDKTKSILPKTGNKQFEPNNSWLQNKQIEKGLQDRKDLLGIERVDRCSQLAVAEWLPHQRKARVTKKSGQEWMNFGLEVNSQLYLIPEEALLLLELNSLELSWNGVPLSVQQAYCTLMDSEKSGCTMEEYRVYSHLARQGYRLQRFHYEREPSQYERIMRLDQPGLKRKKLIVDPQNGLRRGELPVEIDLSSEEVGKDKSEDTEANPESSRNSVEILQLDEPKKTGRDPVEKDVQGLMETMIQALETDKNIKDAGDDENLPAENCRNNVKGNDEEGTSKKITPGDQICGAENKKSMDINLDDNTPTIDNKENLEKCEKTTVQGNGSVMKPEGIADGKTENESPILEKIVSHIPNDSKVSKKLLSELYDNGVENLPGPSNVKTAEAQKKKERKSKVEVISEETLLENFRIVSDTSDRLEKSEKGFQKWPGSRIQRNVKLLPKRNDKSPHPATPAEGLNISVINIDGDGDGDAACKIKNMDSCNGKRKNPLSGVEDSQQKRSKLEVIELSDDEIEEIPQQMSRMEMLNLLPDLAHRTVITETISRRYLPRNVRPQKNTYQYIKSKLMRRQMGRQQDPRNQSQNAENDLRNGQRNANPNQNASGNMTNFLNQNSNLNIINVLFPGMFGNRFRANVTRRGPITNGNTFLNSHTGSFPFLNRFQSNQSTIVRQSVVQDRVDLDYFNRSSAWNQRQQLSIQVNNYTNIAITQNVMRTATFGMQNQLRPNHWQGLNFFQRQNFMNQSSRPFYGHTPTCHYYRNPVVTGVRRNMPSGSFNNRNGPEFQGGWRPEAEMYKPAFKKIQGASSWAETKEKWLEEKTITIEDDQNVEEGEEAMEVQVVDQPVKPLVGRKNSGTLAEVYKSLQIIKSAPERIVRQLRGRTSDYRISYNLYSSTQHFKKANPGPPMFRLVVFRGENSAFIQPTELNRLQREAKDVPVMLCCVSNTSITYAQLGVVSIPYV